MSATNCACEPYSRTDVRVNKSWTKDKWKLTLFGEVINLTNRTNYIFDSFNGYNSQDLPGVPDAGHNVPDPAQRRHRIREVGSPIG